MYFLLLMVLRLKTVNWNLIESSWNYCCLMSVLLWTRYCSNFDSGSNLAMGLVMLLLHIRVFQSHRIRLTQTHRIWLTQTRSFQMIQICKHTDNIHQKKTCDGIDFHDGQRPTPELSSELPTLTLIGVSFCSIDLLL